MDIVDKVIDLLTKQKKTQKELAAFIGIAPSQLNGILKRNKRYFSAEQVSSLSIFFNIDINYLLNNVSESKPVARIPVVGTASCGSTEASCDQKGRYCYYNGDNFAADLYCVIASGDSMAPDIEDGDEIICNPSAQVQHGDMVHYTLHGESAVKVFVRNEEAGIISLKPYSSSPDFKARILRIDDDEMDALKLVKVVAVNKLKVNNRAARLRLVGE